MIKIFIFGINGKMGKVLCAACEESKDFEVAGGFDKSGADSRYPVFTDLKKISATADVVIDFSCAAAIGDVCAFARHTKTPLVIATTGHNEEQLGLIHDLSKELPVFKSANMSVGVNLLLRLIQQAARTLSDFDIEIVEKHHNKKLDAPSGTALMLADAASLEGGSDYCFGRSGNAPRKNGEIGIHAVRGGSIVGEHDVIFAGNDEIVTLSHLALSKRIFADGALKAAKQLLTKPKGLYSFADPDFVC